MTRPRAPRYPTLLLLILLIGMVLGYAHAYGPRDDPEAEIALVTRVFDELSRRAVETLPPQELVYAGVDGMLETLDPHTHFLDQETYRYMQQEQDGEFFGIGISFDIRDGFLTVVAPIEGTPAWKAGIQAGDRIVSIDGEDAKGISTSEVINRLRGGRGEPVTLGVERPGRPGVRDHVLKRDRIPLNSVRYAFMLEPTLAYIRINTFAHSTARELQLSLEELAGQGMKRLILDLRGNSGGLLSTAEEICGMFLPAGSEIVSTKGRVRGSDARLRVRRDGAWSDLPLVVVVDRWSASASEIVAAAVQDHDRGLLIGDVTFGKGLVGSLYSLSHQTALQVTTAQYFTASGRFIQKPYDIPHRKREPVEPPSSDQPLYTTQAGRPVDGGGGITPDVLVEEQLLSDLMLRLDIEESIFFDYAVQYVDRQGKTGPDWVPDPAVMDELIQRIGQLEPPPSAEEIQRNDEAIRRALRREMASVSRDPEAGYRIRLEASEAIQKAVELAPRIEEVLVAASKPD